MVTMQKISIVSVTGKPLCIRLWEGGNTQKNAVVQLIHGMAEHMDRYDPLAQALCEAGYIVVGHDHLGHGPTASKEDLGYFGAKDGWDHLVEDAQAVHQEIARRYPGRKYILLGHSMGSFVAREYLLRYGGELTACVLSGSGWFPAPICHAARAAATLCGAVHGWNKPAPLVNTVAFSSYNKGFKPARTPFDWLSRDEKEVDKYIADPLCGFLFTARGYYDMFSGLLALSRLERLKALPPDLPVYFMSGDRDPVGTQGKGVETVARQFRDAGVRDVTVRLYPAGRHEMFNEINRGEVFADLIAWMDKQV